MTGATDLNAFQGIFFDEAEDNLQKMESELLSLDVNNPDREALNSIFRAAHSLKGGAGTFGKTFVTMVETTHKLENILDKIRDNKLTLTPESVDVFLRARDVLNDQLDAYRKGDAPDDGIASELMMELDTIEQGSSASPKQEIETTPLNTDGHLDPPPTGANQRLKVTIRGISESDAVKIATELEIMGNVLKTQIENDTAVFIVDSDQDPSIISGVCCFIVNEDQVAVEKQTVDAVRAIVSIRDKVTREPVDAQLSSSHNEPKKSPPASADAPQKTAANKESSTIRVPTHRVDLLVDQIGEVVINQSILIQACQQLDPVEHADLLQEIEHMAGALRSLQESVMSLRMVPMDYAFGRFPRVVRETAAKLDKRIDLKTTGGATELDKGLIEKMIDPLTHLIRNSLDHGIEKPDARIAKGKNPVGTISISAYHEGGRIVLEVSDDGGGLNKEKIIDKAIERGMNASHGMHDSDAFQLIFMPGFSTADAITDVSGRGVGMDVVRKNIQEVGGQIQIESKQDVGTTMRISLPLTLAIMDGMSIQVGDERFVMPLNHIKECLQPSQEQIRPIGGGNLMLSLRGENLAILQLSQLLDIRNAETDLTKAILVVVQVGQHRYALAVDHLLGQHQVVVKSLETHYQRVHGISGATILGDGSVALIIDAGTLVSE